MQFQRSEGHFCADRNVIMTSRSELLPRLRSVFGGRVVAWSSGICDYDGRERTLEVFNADARDQLDLLSEFRALRGEVEAALGGPVVVVFHTAKETARLHAEVSALDAEHRIEEDRRIMEGRPSRTPFLGAGNGPTFKVNVTAVDNLSCRHDLPWNDCQACSVVPSKTVR